MLGNATAECRRCVPGETRPSHSFHTQSPGRRAEKSALKKYLDALKVHEEGHVTVAKNFGKEISGKQSAVGATEEKAKSNLQTKLLEYKAEKGNELNFRTGFYDRMTEHGAKQSRGPEYDLPGGGDVILTCP